MVETEVRVRESDGQWVVEIPGGDRFFYPTKGKADAYANAFGVFCDYTARPGSIRYALASLEENQLGDLVIARRLRSKLTLATEREED